MCCRESSLYDGVLGAVCVAECQVIVYLLLCVCCRVSGLYDGVLGAVCVAECQVYMMVYLVLCVLQCVI